MEESKDALADMLLEVLRRFQQCGQERTQLFALDLSIFSGRGWVEDLPERPSMVPPLLPVRHDTKRSIVADPKKQQVSVILREDLIGTVDLQRSHRDERAIRRVPGAFLQQFRG